MMTTIYAITCLPRLRWQSRGEDHSVLRPVRNGKKGRLWDVCKALTVTAQLEAVTP